MFYIINSGQLFKEYAVENTGWCKLEKAWDFFSQLAETWSIEYWNRQHFFSWIWLVVINILISIFFLQKNYFLNILVHWGSIRELEAIVRCVWGLRNPWCADQMLYFLLG